MCKTGREPRVRRRAVQHVENGTHLTGRQLSWVVTDASAHLRSRNPRVMMCGPVRVTQTLQTALGKEAEMGGIVKRLSPIVKRRSPNSRTRMASIDPPAVRADTANTVENSGLDDIGDRSGGDATSRGVDK